MAITNRNVATVLLVLGIGSAPAAAADLFVAGPIGEVFLGDSHDSNSRLSEEQMTTELIYAALAYMGVFGTDALDS